MTRNRPFAFRCLIAVVLVAACASPAAHATWSIATVNPRTGTIGVAAASCSGGVYGIQTVVPGKGVVIVQAASNNDAREAAVAMLSKGVPLDTILAKITDPASGYKPQRQQYALLSSGTDKHPRTYTGTEVPGAKGTAGTDHISVQANTLASEDAVAKTVAALGKADWPDDLAMARAIMRAMEAGAKAGGDRRCSKANSNTAFIGLYRRTDPQDKPWVELAINGLPPSTESGMAHLSVLFQRWLGTGTGQVSTRRFVVPAAVTPQTQMKP